MSIVWPSDIIPNSCEFFLQFNTTVFASPITKRQQVLHRQGEMWRCSIKVDPAQRAKAQKIDALLAKLKGAYDTVQLWDFARPTPSGDNRDRSGIADTRFADSTTFGDGTVFSGGASSVVVWGGAAAGAGSLVTDGWYPSVTGILLAGDYVGIAGKLYLLTDDANSDAIGRATLFLSSGIKSDIPHLAAVTRTQPTAEFRLVDDGQPNRQSIPGMLYTYTLAFNEAL